MIEMAHEFERLIDLAALATGIASARIKAFLVGEGALSAVEMDALRAWARKHKTASDGLVLGRVRR